MTVDRIELSDLEKYLGKNIAPCVVCGNNNFDIHSELEYLKGRQCKECGMISINPYFTKEGIELLYSTYLSNRLADKKTLQQREIMYDIDRDWILRHITRGSVLDIGSSAGYFLSRFNANNFKRMGVERSDECRIEAMNKFNIPIIVGDFTKIEFDEAFDLITMRGVIEHFVDPVSVIERISEIISKGGLLYITATPNGAAFAFDVYRGKWNLFSPDHVHHFSLQHLDNIMSRYSFKLIDYSYQYEETPYANPHHDFNKIKKDICLIAKGHDDVTESVPFPGSMITALWKKI